MVVSLGSRLRALLLEKLEQRSLGNTPSRHGGKSRSGVSQVLPVLSSLLGVGMFSRSWSKEEVDGERPVLLEDGETDGVGGDVRGSETLHTVVVDEALGLDRLHGEVERCRVVNLDTSEGDDELVALQHAELEVLFPVLEISDSNTTLSSLLQHISQTPVAGTARAVDRAPDVGELLTEPLEADSLDSDSTLVLGSGDTQVLSGAVEGPGEGLENVLRVSVGLLHGEVDVLGVGGLSNCTWISEKVRRASE